MFELDPILLLVIFLYELGKIMTTGRYDFLGARFVIWFAIDLLMILGNEMLTKSKTARG